MYESEKSWRITTSFDPFGNTIIAGTLGLLRVIQVKIGNA